jgi:hypothetical protein
VKSSSNFSGRHGSLWGTEISAKTADFFRDNPELKLPSPPRSWNTEVLEAWAADFPNPQVGKLALEVFFFFSRKATGASAILVGRSLLQESP